MFSRTSHPYIQIDDSYLDSSGNPDYDTSYRPGDDIQLRDLSQSGSVKRHAYRALETPGGGGNLDFADSTLKSAPGGSSRPPSDIYKPLPLAPRSRWSGWRFTVASGCITSAFVFICNIALLGWSYGHPWSSTNNLLLFDGDCSEMKRIDTVSHLLINVLSTVLLGASNYAMQVLVAPTRANIDEAHPQGRILDVGISGFGNWRFMGWKRRMLWISLTVSTIPLHLLYNSVLFSTTSAFDYNALIVSQDFLQGASFNVSRTVYSIDNSTVAYLQTMAKNNPGNLTNLTASACLSTLNANYVETFDNVILVTNVTKNNVNNSLLKNYLHDSASSSSDLTWLCDQTVEFASQCNSQSNNWTYLYGNDGATNQYTYYREYGGETQNIKDPQMAKVEYCLAASADPHCTMELIPALLCVVIVCNVVKGLAFAYLAILQFDPLITIGQAVASFLEYPDPTTEGLGAHSARDVRGKWLSDSDSGTYWSELNQDHVYKPERRRWFSGASPLRWTLTLLSCGAYWLIGLSFVLLIQLNSESPTFSVQWAEGFGSILPSAVAQVSQNSSWDVELLGNVLLANFPQIILSFVYVSYNGLFTCMLLSREWVSYAWTRKGLRVHWPQGHQRSTYWLSLPYRYSLPLLVASGLLHWFLSQSIFVAQVNIYTSNDTYNQTGSVNAIGWSGLALTLLLSLGGALILTLVGFGFFRYRPGIPVASSNSRSISAACHPVPGRSRESTERLQYGIISELGDGKYHVGFSSGEVKLLVAGDHYE